MLQLNYSVTGLVINYRRGGNTGGNVKLDAQYITFTTKLGKTFRKSKNSLVKH